VEEDVRVVALRLGDLAHAPDEGQRRGEIGERPLARQRRLPALPARTCRHVHPYPRRPMRIVSLVPHATELLFALGLGDDVVAVTHECDFPTAAQRLPQVTRDRLPAGLSSAGIDAAVRAATTDAGSIYELDEARLRALEPDLIVTQALCPSARSPSRRSRRSPGRSRPARRSSPWTPRPSGRRWATSARSRRRRARGDAARRRSSRASARASTRSRGRQGVAHRPRVVALEWFDPRVHRGHWTPQLIELAGGEDALGFAGEHSEQADWDTVRAARPEVVVCMPCGYDGPRAHLEATLFAHELATLGAGQVVAVDASASFSRPGPRLVDGLELLAHVLHPDRVPQPGLRALTVDV
jgi:iron complex transport system substrate-binding protein